MALAGNLFGEYRKNLHMKNYYCNPFERKGGRCHEIMQHFVFTACAVQKKGVRRFMPQVF